MLHVHRCAGGGEQGAGSGAEHWSKEHEQKAQNKQRKAELEIVSGKRAGLKTMFVLVAEVSGMDRMGTRDEKNKRWLGHVRDGVVCQNVAMTICGKLANAPV